MIWFALIYLHLSLRFVGLLSKCISLSLSSCFDLTGDPDHLSTHLWPIYSASYLESRGILPMEPARESNSVAHCLLYLPQSFLLCPPPLLLLLSVWNWLSRGEERQTEVMNLQCWGLPLWPCCLEDLACSRGSPGHKQGSPQLWAVFVLSFKNFLWFHMSFFCTQTNATNGGMFGWFAYGSFVHELIPCAGAAQVALSLLVNWQTAPLHYWNLILNASVDPLRDCDSLHLPTSPHCQYMQGRDSYTHISQMHIEGADSGSSVAKA